MKKILKNEKGQGIMEYVIISSLIGVFCLAAVSSLGKTIKTRIKNIKSEITKTIKV